MAGNSSIAMELDDVELTDADRIGGAGRGIELVFNVVAPFFLVGLSAVNVGIARPPRRRRPSTRATAATRMVRRSRRCSTCST